MPFPPSTPLPPRNSTLMQACDFPMIMVTLARAKLSLPSQVEFCLDTLTVLHHKSYEKQFSWRNTDDEYWTVFTEKKGVRSMCVEAVATWIASEGMTNPAKNFASACGDAHDALADAKGVQLMLTPGKYGIYDVVMKYKVLEPISRYIDKAKEVMAQPVIEHNRPRVGRSVQTPLPVKSLCPCSLGGLRASQASRQTNS